jgi:UDP-N-acetylglucosamine 1-carboxyvinyltransferase
MQPQMVAYLATADGTSVVTENLYDARFRYVGELARMGADISTEWQHAVIRGVERLSGAPVLAPDIRAGAALVLAGLRADGETVVGDSHHIDRGYEDFVGKLASLGADITRT